VGLVMGGDHANQRKIARCGFRFYMCLCLCTFFWVVGACVRTACVMYMGKDQIWVLVLGR
jgi:hypothetical protein